MYCNSLLIVTSSDSVPTRKKLRFLCFSKIYSCSLFKASSQLTSWLSAHIQAYLRIRIYYIPAVFKQFVCKDILSKNSHKHKCLVMSFCLQQVICQILSKNMRRVNPTEHAELNNISGSVQSSVFFLDSCKMREES